MLQEKTHVVPTFDGELSADYAGGKTCMVFRCRIFENDPFIIVLLSERIGNAGVSITNGIEYAVESVFANFPTLRRTRAVIIEHYEASRRLEGALYGESFDLVTLPRGTDNPVWKSVTKCKVEDLIGGCLCA